MFQAAAYTGNREQDYPLLISQAGHLWEAGIPLSSNLANIAALLGSCLQRVNWVGFYLWDPERQALVVGPFQGLPACTIIPAGKGVCGAAVQTRQTQVVPDVALFPGHIACDSASRSEIVVPLIRGPEVLGVLDVDSPERNRFDTLDRGYLEDLAACLVALWPA